MIFCYFKTIKYFFFQHNSSMHLRQIKDSLPVAVEEMGVGEGMGEALEAVVGVS